MAQKQLAAVSLLFMLIVAGCGDKGSLIDDANSDGTSAVTTEELLTLLVRPITAPQRDDNADG